MQFLLVALNLSKSFVIKRTLYGRPSESVKAVRGVDLRLRGGETLAIVGESGSGKSTLARLILRLIEPDSGSVRLDGEDLTTLSERRLRPTRRRMQFVFQDPFGSLDPNWRVESIVTEPLRSQGRLSRADRRKNARQLLERVGLDPDFVDRYPHEFSGGQRQRLAIARALAPEPDIIVCDEAVSALDVSSQAQILQLLRRLQDETGVAFLFIAHDLAVVRSISDKIAVMYLGQIVEEGLADEVYARPQHPYTLSLLAAAPIPDPTRQHNRTVSVAAGEAPSPVNPPEGCSFHTRCPYAFEPCSTTQPELVQYRTDTAVACHLHSSGPSLNGESVVTLADRAVRRERTDDDDKFRVN